MLGGADYYPQHRRHKWPHISGISRVKKISHEGGFLSTERPEAYFQQRNGAGRMDSAIKTKVCHSPTVPCQTARPYQRSAHALFDESGEVVGPVGGADFKLASGFADRYVHDRVAGAHAEDELVGLRQAGSDKEAAFSALRREGTMV